MMIIATMLLLVFFSYMAFKISTSYSNKTSFELLLAFLISFVAMLFVMMPAITSGSYMSMIVITVFLSLLVYFGVIRKHNLTIL